MELTQLRYFRELARREHLTKTAGSLRITPPSLSVSVSKLEQELGVKLFTRCGRNIRLNENGRLFLEYVDQALETLEAGRNKLAAGLQTDCSRILLGIGTQALWTNGLQAFLDRCPQISISRRDLTTDRIGDREDMAQFDFVLAGASDLHPLEWEYSVLVPDDAPVLVLSKGHPWAGRQEILLEEAADEPFIMPPEKTVSRRFADSLCKAAHIRPPIAAQGDCVMRAHLLHREERAVSITTKLGMASVLLSDLDCIPIRTAVPHRTQALFWPRGKRLAFHEMAFKEFMIRYYGGQSADMA